MKLKEEEVRASFVLCFFSFAPSCDSRSGFDKVIIAG